MARIFCLLAAATLPFGALGLVSKFGVQFQKPGLSNRLISIQSSGKVISFSESRFHQTSKLYSTTNNSEESTKPTGHSPPAGHGVPQREIPPEVQEMQKRISEHQKDAARLSKPEEVRTLIEYSTGYGVMSTFSKDLGFPAGSVIEFALENGLPFFPLSEALQGDILEDPRFSLTVTSKDFKGAQDGRVSLMGDIEKVPSEEIDELREIFLKKHPEATSSETTFFRMKELVDIRFVGGFAMAGGCTPQDYLQAKADPVAAYSSHVIGHMNDDHADATAAMVKHYITGCDVEDADIVSMDSLGMSVKVTIMGDTGKLRLPFVRRVKDRKDLKNIIVEMTQASADA